MTIYLVFITEGILFYEDKEDAQKFIDENPYNASSEIVEAETIPSSKKEN